jgi:hypothetical protein
MSGETENQVSGWTVDTLKEMLTAQLEDLSAKLDERYATQTKATDAAFVAQQTAMKTAFDAADKAVQAALAAAKEASGKAEGAADKRFEATNEFRAQLTDQAQTFMPRLEYDTAHRALTEKLDIAISRNAERVSALELRLSSRLDMGAGEQKGARTVADDGRWRDTYNQSGRTAADQAKYSVVAMVISGISVIVAVAMVLVVISIH